MQASNSLTAGTPEGVLLLHRTFQLFETRPSHLEYSRGLLGSASSVDGGHDPSLSRTQSSVGQTLQPRGTLGLATPFDTIQSSCASPQWPDEYAYQMISETMRNAEITR